jgi:4-hydroxybenzoate polyprenyltransferase
MRPANIVTAWADILAGFAATDLVFLWLESTGTQFGFFESGKLVWLLLSTTGLYGGGVVFNDVFDAKLDKVERPERPIPSGRASDLGAVLLGVVLLIAGVLFAFQVTPFSGKLSIVIAIAALNYNKVAKHNPIVGPINMGLCRGLNLMLGMSAALAAVYLNWFICLIPIVFISAITMISRSEVSGGDKRTILFGGILFGIVIASILVLPFFMDYSLIHTLPFLCLFVFMVFKPLTKAYNNPDPSNIKASVRGGILALIPMDAAIAAGFAGWVFGVLILLLLPVSMLFAKRFAVT